MHGCFKAYVAALLIYSGSAALAEDQPKPSVAAEPVTVDNFPRAESDMYFGGLIKESGGIGKLSHRREPARIDNQTVVRPDRTGADAGSDLR